VNYINLTPHEINVFGEEVDVNGVGTGKFSQVMTIPASGTIARVAVKPVYCFTDAKTSVNFYRQEVGDVTGLPAKEDGVWLVVSAQVRLELPSRSDLVSPGELIRNAEGQPVGCKGLYINKQS